MTTHTDDEALIEEFRIGMAQIIGKEGKFAMNDMRDLFAKLLATKNQQIEEARRQGAWIGFHAAGEGFNGEYVSPRCTDEIIWAALEEALHQKDGSDPSPAT